MNDYEQQLNEAEEKIIAQRKEIEELKEENKNIKREAKNYFKISNDNRTSVQIENDKLKEENKALQGVIDGMKIIIKNLEDERNRQNNNTN